MFTITELRQGECRGPLTSGPPHYFCGQPTAPNSSYCALHHKSYCRGPGQSIKSLAVMIDHYDTTVRHMPPAVRERLDPEVRAFIGKLEKEDVDG